MAVGAETTVTGKRDEMAGTAGKQGAMNAGVPTFSCFIQSESSTTTTTTAHMQILEHAHTCVHKTVG